MKTAVCGNSRDISLLATAGNVLPKIMLTRLVQRISEGILPETQSSFRKGRGTTDLFYPPNPRKMSGTKGHFHDFHRSLQNLPHS